MVVNSMSGAFSAAPRAVDRSQFVQNRWNPYTSGPSEVTMPLAPGYGFEGPGAAQYHPSLGHHPHHHQHHPSLHQLVAAADGSQGHGMKFTSSGDTGYGASGHGGSGGGGYDYHPPPPPPHPPLPSIIHHPLPPLWPAPSGKGKGKGAALSALTLLAFLYFLNMLQSCLKDHMDTMNPTVMVMTAGATRRKDSIDRLDSSASLEQAADSSEETAPNEAPQAGPEGPVEAYERLSHRYQLLTSSNRTRNPFNRRPSVVRPRKKSSGSSSAGTKRAPSRYASHADSEQWYDRSTNDHRE